MINRFINNLFIKQFFRQKTHFKCFSSIKSSKVNSNSDVKTENENLFECERDFDELTVDSFKSLITEQKIREKIELILSEYEYEKYTTLRVPTTITTDQMQDLIGLDPPERKRWFSYLFKREIARNKTNEKRRQHSAHYWTQKRENYSKTNAERTGMFDHNQQLIYGLWHNALFAKIPKNAVNRYYSHRLRNAALFGQKVVIDMDFDRYMKLSESRQLVNQIHLLYNYNRYRTKQPFDLHFVNCNTSDPSMQTIPKLLPNHKSPDFLAEFHSKSYLDLFPKERLLYLSPHSTHTLKTLDFEDIYILGGFIDKSYRQPLSYIKAQKDGIRCYRLPIDENIIWGVGSKYLCLNHIIGILHDMSLTGDWRKSLRDNIPARKLKKVEDIECEDMLRKEKFKRFLEMKSKKEAIYK